MSIHDLEKSHVSLHVDQPSTVAVPDSSNAITLPLDLNSNAAGVARRQAEQEGTERRWRNLAGPSESQLDWWKQNAPTLRDNHLSGDDGHAEGGELITWVNDKCFYTTHGPTTFGMAQTSGVCKDPPKADTELFKDMRKKLDEGAKSRVP